MGGLPPVARVTPQKSENDIKSYHTQNSELVNMVLVFEQGKNYNWLCIINDRRVFYEDRSYDWMMDCLKRDTGNIYRKVFVKRRNVYHDVTLQLRSNR